MNEPRSSQPGDSETLFALLESVEVVAQMGSWEFRPDQGLLIWSDNLFRILGFSPGAFEPSLESLLERVHPDDVEELAAEVGRIAAAPAPRPPVDYRIIRPDGVVRHIRSVTALVDATPGERTIIGSVQDRTESYAFEREIAAHMAVASALERWESLDAGGTRLLRMFADAMHLENGAIWIPTEHGLEPQVVWRTERAGGTSEFMDAVAGIRIPRGVGLEGVAWERNEPISSSDVGAELTHSFRAASAREGLRGAIAFPAHHAAEVLAVFGFATREEIELTERLHDCLMSIGTEVGLFLSRRRGELVPARLTHREIEVLQLAAQGNPGPRIAAQLQISVATVRTHFEHIYDKLGVSDRGTAVATALRDGLIE
jgi:DNA-binding CsgD family transcriptional regulator